MSLVMQTRDPLTRTRAFSERSWHMDEIALSVGKDPLAGEYVVPG